MADKLALSVTEAAAALGISRSAMYNLIHQEGFPTLRVGARRLISRELLAEWVRTQASGQKETPVSVRSTDRGRAEQV